MAENSTTQERTEKPTQRRRREARREGQVAKSQEIGVAISLGMGLLVLRLFGPGIWTSIADETRYLFANAGNGLSYGIVGERILSMLALGILPFVLFAAALGVAGGVAQVGFLWAPKAAIPKLSNLSLKKGLQRFKPTVAMWELGRTALKLGLLLAVVWVPLAEVVETLMHARRLDVALAAASGAGSTILVRAALLALAIAVTDYVVNYRRTEKKLKMTKQELRREMKESEGDPIAKGLRRRRAFEMSRNRMIFEVSTADVVVTNPTHYAVALRYRPPEPAPRVVAKGTNRVAARIRKEAYFHGVPVVESPPLARELFRRVKLGKFVPGRLYEAVAVVLSAAYRRRGRAA